MKKIKNLLLASSFAVLGLVGMTACQGESKLKVDVFFYDYSDTYIASVRASMTTQLDALADTITYTFYDGGSNQATQTTQIDTAITQGSDMLIVNIVTTGSDETAQGIVDAAEEAKIPLIFFNREVSDTVVESYDDCIFVGTDADEAGVMQGEMIADWLQEGTNAADADVDGDHKIDYLMFRGELGNAEAFGRTYWSVKTANDQLAAASSLYSLQASVANSTDSTQPADGISPFYLYGNWSAATATNLMGTALSAHPDFETDGSIEMIIANNDDQALGAIEALNEENYNTGAANGAFVPVFGVDATAVAKAAIADGKMVGTIKQDNVAMATGIVDFADDFIAGTSFDLTGYNVDTGVNKVRIPYAIYLGE